MTVTEALRSAWNSAGGDAGKDDRTGDYQRRIPLSFSVPIHAGIILPSILRLLSFDFTKTDLHGLNLHAATKGYLVEVKEQGKAERVSVIIREESNCLPNDLFHGFCVDVLQHISRSNNSSEAAKTLYRRLKVWKRFFQNQSLQGLSREQYIGLFGEIEFFEISLKKGLNPNLISDAWKGQFGSNQDFLFGELAVEVKAVSGNDAGSFRVSNIRQLDNTGLRQLFLSYVAYDFRENSGRRMSTLVQSVKELLDPAPEALETFNDGLLASGYSEPDQSPYADYGFTERKRGYCTVAEDFPRILEKHLPVGVTGISYTVQLAACEKFIVSEMELFGILKQ